MLNNQSQRVLLKAIRSLTIVIAVLAAIVALAVNHIACNENCHTVAAPQKIPIDNVSNMKKPETVVGFSSADYTRHIEKIKNKIPNENFSIIIEKPFVVIGDESTATLRQLSKHTIRWAVDLLKQDYFEKDPAEIIDIWLFKDGQSYRKYTRSIFNDTQGTPFGYFSREHNALIMNIATGGGTLVHEIVHPFMSANFSECPAWFNEGLASLYEQCRENNGHISGLTNWRLAGLQQDIKANKLPSFEWLTHTTDNEFYRGDNYGQARYLCYYLQQKQMLVRFYHEFRKNCTQDPSGYETLKKVLGEEDMSGFRKRWENFVLKLTFP